MYACDDAPMERIELARIIHQERIRDVEAALYHRRLLHAIDDIEPSTTSATPSQAGAAAPASPSQAQPAGPASRPSTSPVR